MSQAANTERNKKITRSNSFDNVKELIKPITKTKRKKGKPKPMKPSQKDKESLKMKIVRAAKSCNNVEELRILPDKLLNEGKQLEFGNTELKLDMNKDALDQMIEFNCFPPVDQWRCPI
jgi:hypothetical protein